MCTQQSKAEWYRRKLLYLYIKNQRYQDKKRQKQRPQVFFGRPIIEEAKQYHRELKNQENKEPQSSTDFYLKKTLRPLFMDGV